MDCNQSPMTSQGDDARQARIVVMLLSFGIVAALVLPLWGVALLMLGALVALRLLATTGQAAVPVVIRRDSRR